MWREGWGHHGDEGGYNVASSFKTYCAVFGASISLRAGSGNNGGCNMRVQ